MLPDYIEDILQRLSPYVRIELLRLLSSETNQSNIIQKRYRAKLKDNRQKYLDLGLVLQLYKDLNGLEGGNLCE